MRSRIVVVILAGALAGALLAPASPAVAGGNFILKLKAPGHHPKAGKKWHIKVKIRSRGGRIIRGIALYKFLYNGSVVSTQYPAPRGGTRHKPLKFKGGYQDDIDWPAAAVGYRLVFRVVVRSPGRGKRSKDYWVKVVS
jgi:hypothetical protein